MLSSGLKAIPEGARPTAISRVLNVCSSITLIVPETAVPVTGSVNASEPLVGAVVSDARGTRPPRFDTKIL
jgi:hypothetical protein